MPENFLHLENSPPFPDRRKVARARLKSVVYVELEAGNGGLILNLSDDGIAVQAAEPIIGAAFPHLRFCLPNSTQLIDVEGELVWKGASRKEAGIQFVGISAEARAQIRNWLNGANASPDALIGDGSPNIAEQQPFLELVQEEVDLSEDLDSMFPSEKQIARGRGPVVHCGAEFFPSEAATQAPFGRNRAPMEPPAGTLESEISAQAQRRPNRSDLHSYSVSARPRAIDGSGVGPAVEVEQAGVDSSHPDSDPEPGSSEHGSAMLAPNFKHASPNLSSNPPNSSPNPSPNPSIDPNADRATHERLVAAFSAAANPPSAHSNTPPQAGLPNESAHTTPNQIPIAFSGFGYQPSEFEEPFGKKWIGVAAILLAVVAIGVVLAVGPANVKNLIVRRHTIFESLAGPPPPSLPEKHTEKPDTAANVAPSEKAVEPATSPAVAPSDARDVQSSQSGSPSAADPARSVDRATSDSAKGSEKQYGAEDTADPEAELLKFQREHSQNRSTPTESYRAPTDGSVPYPKPDVSATPIPPTASTAAPRDPSIGDARGNSQVSRSTSEADRAPSEPPRSTSQTQQPGDGIVAIRSSFNAVRGLDVEPSEQSSNNGALVAGQLRTMRQPNYPVEALRAHIEGTVTLRATANRTGTVQAVQLIGGPPILVPAAIEAVRQWRYAPTTLNGQAVECTEDISVVFRIANSVSVSH